MRVIKKTVQGTLEEKALFKKHFSGQLMLDIETTGLSASRSMIYLVGCLYSDNDHLILQQFLCEKPADEYELLFQLQRFLQQFTGIVHFNGSSFDIPFIKKRMHKYRISYPQYNEYDLLKFIRPYKTRLGLDNLKLKTLEATIGIHREDQFTGQQLIEVYENYLRLPPKSKEQQSLEYVLCLHNEEDMIGMLKLLPYYEPLWILDKLKQGELLLSHLSVAYAERYLVYRFKSENKLPLHFMTSSQQTSLSTSDQEGFYELTLPIVTTTLKYFLSPIHEYRYFPERDEALHQRFALLEPKASHMKATPHNCYTKCQAQFLMVPVTCQLSLKSYKENYDAKYHGYIFTELTNIDMHQHILRNTLKYLSQS